MKQEKMTANDKLVDNRCVVARFATLLGAFRLKDMPKEKPGSSDGCLSTLFSSKPGAQCSAPSLSLLSTTCKIYHNTQEDKHQIEEHATLNLAHPLFARNINSGTNSTQDNSISEKNKSNLLPIHKLPSAILDNLAESFLTLIDARLRAYITILARHGVNLSECPFVGGDELSEGVLSLGKKLGILINIGTGVNIENIVTLFSLGQGNVIMENERSLEFTLVMETTMDVSIPSRCNGSELVTMAANTKGLLKGEFCLLLELVA